MVLLIQTQMALRSLVCAALGQLVFQRSNPLLPQGNSFVWEVFVPTIEIADTQMAVFAYGTSKRTNS